MAAPLPQSWHCLAGTSQMKQKHCAPGSSSSVGALQMVAALAGRRQVISFPKALCVAYALFTSKTGELRPLRATPVQQTH